MWLGVILFQGAWGAALEGAQADLPRKHGCSASCGGRKRCLKVCVRSEVSAAFRTIFSFAAAAAAAPRVRADGVR